MTELRLNLFGTPRLEREGARVEIDTRKALALLAYLASTQQQPPCSQKVKRCSTAPVIVGCAFTFNTTQVGWRKPWANLRAPKQCTGKG
jgi:hypothetical protein